jgi:hypothetical protein
VPRGVRGGGRRAAAQLLVRRIGRLPACGCSRIYLFGCKRSRSLSPRERSDRVRRRPRWLPGLALGSSGTGAPWPWQLMRSVRSWWDSQGSAIGNSNQTICKFRLRCLHPTWQTLSLRHEPQANRPVVGGGPGLVDALLQASGSAGCTRRRRDPWQRRAPLGESRLAVAAVRASWRRRRPIPGRLGPGQDDLLRPPYAPRARPGSRASPPAARVLARLQVPRRRASTLRAPGLPVQCAQASSEAPAPRTGSGPARRPPQPRPQDDHRPSRSRRGASDSACQ